MARLGYARAFHRAGSAERGHRGGLPSPAVRRDVLRRVHLCGADRQHDLSQPLLPDEPGEPAAGRNAPATRIHTVVDDLGAARANCRRVPVRGCGQDQPRLAVPRAAHAHLALPEWRFAVTRPAAAGAVGGLRHELGRRSFRPGNRSRAIVEAHPAFRLRHTGSVPPGYLDPVPAARRFPLVDDRVVADIF